MNNEFPKLSRKEFKILELLIAKGEMFGLEMVEASEGELKRGTIYVTFAKNGRQRLHRIPRRTRQIPEIGIPRRKYSATGLGERVYQTNLKAKEFFNSELVWGGI